MQPEPEEVNLWLEWAGQRILSIRVNRIFPSDIHSSWPDYPQDKFTAFGYTNIKLRSNPPSKDEIPLMDEILNLVHIVPDIQKRQILNARSLINPISQRHLNSWAKIAALISSNPQRVKFLHQKGLEFISRRVSEPQVYRFRNYIG